MSDKLCRENGLSVVIPGKGSKGKSYAEYQAEKTGTSWKGKLKIAVDTLIPQVASFEELLQRLQAAGYGLFVGFLLQWVSSLYYRVVVIKAPLQGLCATL